MERSPFIKSCKEYWKTTYKTMNLGAYLHQTKIFRVSKDMIHRVKMQPLRNGCKKNDLKNLQLSNITVDFRF